MKPSKSRTAFEPDHVPVIFFVQGGFRSRIEYCELSSAYGPRQRDDDLSDTRAEAPRHGQWRCWWSQRRQCGVVRGDNAGRDDSIVPKPWPREDSMKAHSLAEEAVMDTFFVARLPKWSIVLFGRNPLVRPVIGSRHWSWC